MRAQEARALNTPATSRPAWGVVRPPERAPRATIAIAPRAPAKAASGTTGETASAPATSASTPATAAPPEMPSRWGQASGLPRRAWSAAPAAARLPPTTAPSSTRGRRVRKRITASVLSGPASARARLTCTGPTSEVATSVAARRHASTAVAVARRLAVKCGGRTLTPRTPRGGWPALQRPTPAGARGARPDDREHAPRRRAGPRGAPLAERGGPVAPQPLARRGCAQRARHGADRGPQIGERAVADHQHAHAGALDG